MQVDVPLAIAWAFITDARRVAACMPGAEIVEEIDARTFLANAKVKLGSRYIRLPDYGQAGHKTLGNWYTTLLNAHGNPIDHFGAVDTGLDKFGINQLGAIAQFQS